MCKLKIGKIIAYQDATTDAFGKLFTAPAWLMLQCIYMYYNILYSNIQEYVQYSNPHNYIQVYIIATL